MRLAVILLAPLFSVLFVIVSCMPVDEPVTLGKREISPGLFDLHFISYMVYPELIDDDSSGLRYLDLLL